MENPVSQPIACLGLATTSICHQVTTKKHINSSYIYIATNIMETKLNVSHPDRKLIWLGCYLFDSKLMFRPHIDNIVSKAALRAKMIPKCFRSHDPSLQTRAFCTFVRPVLKYCSTIWNLCFKRDSNKIEFCTKAIY